MLQFDCIPQLIWDFILKFVFVHAEVESVNEKTKQRTLSLLDQKSNENCISTNLP